MVDTFDIGRASSPAVAVLERALDPVRLLILAFLVVLVTTRFGASDQEIGDDVKYGLIVIAVLYSGAILWSLRADTQSIVHRLLHPLTRVVVDTLVALMVLLLVDTAAGPLAWLVLAMPMLTANIHYGSFVAAVAWLFMSLSFLGLSIVSSDSGEAANDALGAGIQQLFALLIIASGIAVVVRSIRDRVDGTEDALREARSRSRQLSGIAASAQTMADLDDPLAVLGHATEVLPSFGFSDGEVIERLGPQEYRVLAAMHRGDRRLVPANLLTDRALETGEMHVLRRGDALSADQELHLRDYQLGAAVPIAEHPGALVVRAWVSSDFSMPSKNDLRSFELYARQVSTAYINAVEVRRLEARGQELAWEADHDALTGLANRAQLMRVLGQRLATGDPSRNRPAPVALLFLDLDGFKAANDTHGHLVGDQVLIETGRRLSRLVERPHLLGRLGGDEFLVIADTSTSLDIGAFGDRIVHSISQPLTVGEAVVHLGTSVGVARAGVGTGADELLQLADQAMYEAKQSGGSRVIEARRTPMPFRPALPDWAAG